MINNLHIVFAPLLPIYLFGLLNAVIAILAVYGILRRAKGAFTRALMFALILIALSNPSIIEEQRAPLTDTALVVVDDSPSMQIGLRLPQAIAAEQKIMEKLATLPDLEVETLKIKGTDQTDLFQAIDQKLVSIPRDRLAGIIVITDGQVEDKPATTYNAPLHVLIDGKKDEFDRRIIVKQAPAYGLVETNVTLTLRIDDEPKPQSETASVTFYRDDGKSQKIDLPVGKDIPFDVPLTHPGQNMFVFSTAPLDNELTPINNNTQVTINAIRDRLRVLLISGQPHIGGRSWRNYLKADPAVDLIHFTILRSLNKQDSIPNSELSLIAFPVRELFETKLRSFNLIIFDRFSHQSLVPDTYLENIANYVNEGGALLISNNTDQAIPALNQSPLGRILPAQPAGTLLTGAFVPNLSEAGKRHPVTNALTSSMPRDEWGHWHRQIEASTSKGETLMTGINDRPLLVLDHVGSGRVAQFLSDQFWLWARGYEGGGPQAELLRRVAHWLVQEPELDENALHARVEPSGNGWQVIVTKQSLHDASHTIQIVNPENVSLQLQLKEGKQPGLLEGAMQVVKTGLYHLKDGSRETLVMVGPSNTPEFNDMRATEKKLKPVIDATRGSAFWLQDYPEGPEIRQIRAGAAQQGRNWIGLKQNGQYRVTGGKAYPLLPPWVMITLIVGLAMFAWRREGQS